MLNVTATLFLSPIVLFGGALGVAPLKGLGDDVRSFGSDPSELQSRTSVHLRRIVQRHAYFLQPVQVRGSFLDFLQVECEQGMNPRLMCHTRSRLKLWYWR